MAFSTLSAQQLFWDFNDGTTTDLTITNGSVYTGTGSGRPGDNFPGTALMFHPTGARSVTMPAVDASSGTAELSFKMIYGNNSNGGENVDNGEHVLLEYSTDGGANFTISTEWSSNSTYQQSGYTNVSVALVGPLAAANIIYKLRQRSHSGGCCDHWAIDDLFLDVVDVTPPTITQTILAADNSEIVVTFSEAVYTATGATTDLVVGDFALSLSGGQATLSSPTPSSISISPGKDVLL